jgi:hypothetical protein
MLIAHLNEALGQLLSCVVSIVETLGWSAGA